MPKSNSPQLAGEIDDYNIAINLLYPGMIRSEGMIIRAPANILDTLPSPSIVGPPAVWLAAQNAANYTGKIGQVETFGSEWP